MIRVIHKDASKVSSKASEVVVLGPEDVDISLSPAAAIRTAGQLVEKAAEAIRKQDSVDADCKRWPTGASALNRRPEKVSERDHGIDV